MNSHANASALAPSADQREAVRGTLPLLLLVAFLFVAAYFIFLLDPALGPSEFPLWSLFVVLGIIAGAGAFVSWVYADDRPSDPSPAATPAVAEPALTVADRRSEFGRPVPDVARPERSAAPPAPAAEPWNEDLVPVSAASAPAPPAPEAPSEISRALDEIDDIQRELMGRRPARKDPVGNSAGRA
ncbi:MAG TPA: hypothetical protein VMF04_05120 [Thermoplasmata archaeon]|nr:hypothetical protein [Thermoplasmata archaeon]